MRFVVNVAVYLGAAAVGLLAADVLLTRVSVAYPIGFLSAVCIFALIQALVSPLLSAVTERNAEVLTGGVGIFSAFVALFVTSLVSDNLSVSGLVNWLLAALIIWIASMAAGFVIKMTVAKKVLNS